MGQSSLLSLGGPGLISWLLFEDFFGSKKELAKPSGNLPSSNHKVNVFFSFRCLNIYNNGFMMTLVVGPIKI